MWSCKISYKNYKIIIFEYELPIYFSTISFLKNTRIYYNTVYLILYLKKMCSDLVSLKHPQMLSKY